MKKCSYCGRENDDSSGACHECGTELPPPIIPLPIPPLLNALPLSATQVRPGAPSFAPPRKTSRFAIASLVFGLLGFFFITAFAGIICGIAGLVQISQRRGRLKGQGLALAGICLSSMFLVAMPVALLVPALAKARFKAHSKAPPRAQHFSCINNLKQLSLALRMYAYDNRERFPLADQWCDVIMPQLNTMKIYRCPTGPAKARCTYALNAKLSNLPESKIHPETVVLFEAPDGWNGSGGVELMLRCDYHGGAYNVIFFNGNVRLVPASRLRDLRWDP